MTASLQPTFDACPQCGLVHPPLREGMVCPMRPVKSVTGTEIDTSKFFSSLKNILISQIQKKQIKNPNKLMNEMIVHITTFAENYKE
jgi:hypothetical protein